MNPDRPHQRPDSTAGSADGRPIFDDDATRPMSREDIERALQQIRAETASQAALQPDVGHFGGGESSAMNPRFEDTDAVDPATAMPISPQMSEHLALRAGATVAPSVIEPVSDTMWAAPPATAPAPSAPAQPNEWTNERPLEPTHSRSNAGAETAVSPPAQSAHQPPSIDDAQTVLIMRAPPPSPSPAPLPPSEGFGNPLDNTNSLPGANGLMGDLETRQVGRYEVRSRLGRGGMATVYKAHDPSIGRDLAIKFLHASLCEDEECRMRFLREARASGGLSHPNIVVVHDVGEIQRRPYMAMELIDGAPLSETLERSKKLPIADVVSIGIQLARALEYAHLRGIVHRDIKPGNIMLLRDGHTIKVADFGIAHMDDGGSGSEQRTLVGAVMGTPQYMSPEQTRGDKVDGRSDLFSAGIVMYQMLAGERPFRGESLVAVATKIATEEPPPLPSKRPDVPASLRRVVERCLAKQPQQRYQSGRELAEALLKVQAELDEAARERDTPRIVPLRVKWAATMACIVAVVMGITTTIVTWRQNAAMTAQVADYGSSLARFIAAQNAASVLGDEWEPVEVAVQELMKTSNFERVSVVDLAGTVRVSSQPGLIGKPYVPLAPARNGVAQYSVGNESVLGFEAPVLFGGKQVGRVALGIPEAPLTAVARLSISLMLVLLVVTVLSVAIAMYFVANWFAKPIRLVGESMAEIGKGRFDHRIAEHRKDEFGQLFQAFDAMAEALQKREPAASGPPTATLPPVSHPTTGTSANHEAAPPQASRG